MAVIRTVTIEPGENIRLALSPGPGAGGGPFRDADPNTGGRRRGDHQAGPGADRAAGAEHVHIGYNHGADRVVILANYQASEGCLLAVPAMPPARVPPTRVGRPDDVDLVGPTGKV